MARSSGFLLMAIVILYFSTGALATCNLKVYSESRPEYNGFMGGIQHFAEHVTRSRMDCDRKCTMSTPCKGYTFDHATKECHLLNFTLSDTIGLTARSTAVYFARLKALPGAFSCPNGVDSWYSVPVDDGCINIRHVNTYSNHDQALAGCKSLGGRLFVLNSLPRWTLYTNLINCPGFGYSYLVDGRNDNATDYYAADAYKTGYGEVVPMMTPLWVWSGTSWLYYSPATQHCLYMHGSHLHTFSCTSTMYYLCEKNY